MDKYEYKVRADEIKELIAREEYVQAAEIADTIDWRRVKSVMMLCTISDLYKMNRRYEDAKNMLLLAYERRPGGRTICYSLCELCIKTEEIVPAVNYYQEYVQAAPKDPGRYILQYKLYEAQGVSLEERIGVLEELKKRDYREKWGYELAYLYHRVGLGTRCVEECDELILWFGEGKYVVKAMELKMLHEPLTPSQQKKYEHRFDIPEQDQEGTEGQEETWNTREPNRKGNGWNDSDREEGQEGSWAVYGQGDENSQWDTYGQTGEENQWDQAYNQSGEEEQWNQAHNQAGGGQWNQTYNQSGEEEQWNQAHNQTGEGNQWSQTYHQNQQEEQWNQAYHQSTEEQWTDYGQSAGKENGSSEQYPPEAGMEPFLPPEQDELEIQVKTMDVSQYNTMNLQAELAAGLQEVLEAEEIADSFLVQKSAADEDEGTPEGTGAAALEENSTEAVSVLETALKGTTKTKNEAAVKEENTLSETAVKEENVLSETAVKGENAASENVLEWQNPTSGTFTEEAVSNEKSADNFLEYEDSAAEPTETKQDIVRDDTAELVLAQMKLENAANKAAGISASELEQNTVVSAPVQESSAETGSQSDIVDSETIMVEKQITGQMNIEDILAEWEQTKKSSEEKYKEEIRQDVLRQTGPMFTEFEAAARDDLLERLEKGEKVDLEEIDLSQEAIEGWNFGKSIEERNLLKSTETVRAGNATEERNLLKPAESVDTQSVIEGSNLFKSTESVDTQRVIEGSNPFKPAESVDTQRVIEGSNPFKPTESVDTQSVIEGSNLFKSTESIETKGVIKGRHLHKPVEIQKNGKSAAKLIHMDEIRKAWGKPTKEKAAQDEAEMWESLTDVQDEAQMQKALSHMQGEAQMQETLSHMQDEAQMQETLSHMQGETQVQEVVFHVQEKSNMQNEVKMQEALTDKQDETQTAKEPAKVPRGAGMTEVVEASGKQESHAFLPKQEEITTKTAVPKDKVAFGAVETVATTSPGGVGDKPVEREKVKIRGLTREEKELYAPFIQSRSAREKLVQAIDNISLAAYTGNIVVTGEEGMDTLTFAKNMIREVQMIDSNFSGKVAKISGESLNGKDVNETLWHLNNGALIIYRASGMNARTASELHRALQQENLGIIIVLEDTKKAIQKMFLGTPDLYGCFTARMDLEALSNDTLVAFGKRYAREKEYSIDNLGVLALHTRIEELQTIDHVVTVVEVKKIVDEAIRHACRKTLRHFFDILFAKRYDDEDMIILTEKDFAY